MRIARHPSPILRPLTAGLILGLTAGLAIAQTPSPPQGKAAPAANVAAPKLAPGVKPAERGYEPVAGRWVVALPTPFYVDISPYSEAATREHKAGEPVTLLAKVKDNEWYLVGENGVGVGYVGRARIKPAAG